MKLCALILITIVTVASPVQAQVASFPPNFEIPKQPAWLDSKDIDKKERRFRLSDRLTVTVDDHMMVGRVPVEPIQAYAGSRTYIRRVLGVSVRWQF